MDVQAGECYVSINTCVPETQIHGPAQCIDLSGKNRPNWVMNLATSTQTKVVAMILFKLVLPIASNTPGEVECEKNSLL